MNHCPLSSLRPSSLRPMFSVLYTNIRSLIPKIDDLCGLISDTDASIVALTETWLSPDKSNDQLSPLTDDFVLYRHDRIERRGGGVLIAVRRCAVSDFVQTNSPLDICWVSVDVGHGRVVIGVCYRPPGCDGDFVRHLHDNLYYMCQRFPKSRIILLGDFNYPNIDWENWSASSSEAKDFLELLLDFGFCQIVNEPTRVSGLSCNILDLVLTNSPEIFTSCHLLNGLSDHKLMIATVSLPLTKTLVQPKVIRNYSRANFDVINHELVLYYEEFARGFLPVQSTIIGQFLKQQLLIWLIHMFQLCGSGLLLLLPGTTATFGR